MVSSSKANNLSPLALLPQARPLEPSSRLLDNSQLSPCMHIRDLEELGEFAKCLGTKKVGFGVLVFCIIIVLLYCTEGGDPFI